VLGVQAVSRFKHMPERLFRPKQTLGERLSVVPPQASKQALRHDRAQREHSHLKVVLGNRPRRRRTLAGVVKQQKVGFRAWKSLAY
jgi:hypothetical protein